MFETGVEEAPPHHENYHRASRIDADTNAELIEQGRKLSRRLAIRLGLALDRNCRDGGLEVASPAVQFGNPR